MLRVSLDVVSFLPIFDKSLLDDKEEPLLQHMNNRLALCCRMIQLHTEENWELYLKSENGELVYNLLPIEDAGTLERINWMEVIEYNLHPISLSMKADEIINKHLTLLGY